MGHDITAWNGNVDLDNLREQYKIDDWGAEDWGKRYKAYCEQAQIAYNRRAAWNPLNRALYDALGVVEEAYGGCSGLGVELDITLEMLQIGLQRLQNEEFIGITHDDKEDRDVSQEITFITNCINFLEKNELPSLKVSFG